MAAERAYVYGSAEPLERRVLLGTLLVGNGDLTLEALEQALTEKERSGRPLGQILTGLGLITGETLARGLAEQYQVEYLDLSILEIDAEAVSLLPESVARRYQALPVRFLDRTTVLVAVADPTNLLRHDDLRLALGVDMRIAVAESDRLEDAITRCYRTPLEVGEVLSEVTEQAHVQEIDVGPSGSAPAIRFVNEVIGSALDHGASDVHFEPQAERLVVRIRVDGVTRELVAVPNGIHAAVAARLKVMGGLDIAQRRTPQDGRVAIRFAGQTRDLRIAVLPTTYGERVTLRILHGGFTGLLGPAELGMSADTEATFRRAISRPYGAVIACGPTGSGKTTTLYAGLDLLNDAGRVVVTIEDPVEYQVPGISQIEIDPPAGLTFARGLRTILRSDPDVILVGEIRDEETARIAIQAATTGHLVLTTLHAHNAASAIVRLKDMGIVPGLLATSINCIVAQRLARRLCLSCRELYTPSADERAEFGLAGGAAEVDLYRACGCNACLGTGYRGRVALYEAMPVDSSIRRLIDASTEDILASAVEHGMTTLRESGVGLCFAGVTSLDEIRRVTGAPEA